MQCVDESFLPCLEDHDLDKLERDAGTVYAVRPDFCSAYMNPAWFRFAEDNGGEPDLSSRWPRGSPLMPAISPALRSCYEIRLGACLEGGEPRIHEYECSSADVYRAFRQTAYPLKKKCGLPAVNSLAIESDHDPADCPPKTAAEKRCRDENGAIRQCASCRRVGVPPHITRWEWVPDRVEQPPSGVTFVLCGSCEARYRVETP